MNVPPRHQLRRATLVVACAALPTHALAAEAETDR